jgi:tRNA G18 (ribose-2'-O)-methylase SpoU
MPIEITDPADERVSDYFSLTDVNLRKKLEPARGLYLAESEKVIRRALGAGHRPRSFLMGERWLTDLADLVEQAESSDVPVYVAEAAVIQAMTGFHLHRGALASMHRPVLAAPESLLQNASRIAIFEDIVDHSNLGAAFRSAAALGIDGVLITQSCADPFYRRSIRVSMGTVFQVPWTRIPLWPKSIDMVREAGFTTAALALSDEAITLDQLAAQRHAKLALIIGTEGKGLRRATLSAVDAIVRIPMGGGVDSLNVAAAAAVAFYATNRPEYDLGTGRI